MFSIEELIKNANKSPLSSKHAAALVRGHTMSFVSTNWYDDCNHDNIFTYHAEESVLNKISNCPKFNMKKLPKYTMIVIRVHKKRLAESKPCSECLNKLRDAGIRKVIYSTKEGTLCYTKTKHINGILSSGYVHREFLNKEKHGRKTV